MDPGLDRHSGGGTPGTSTYRWAFIGVVGALAIVAAASVGNPVSTPLRSEDPDRLEVLKTVLGVTGAGLIVALALGTLFHHAIISRRTGSIPLWHTLLRAAPITVAAIAMLALFTIARVHLRPAAIPQLTLYEGGGGRPPEPLGIRDQRSPPVIVEERDLGPVDTIWARAQARAADSPPYGRILLSIIALLIALKMLSKRRRVRAARMHEESVPPAEEVAVHGAVVSSIDAMLQDPDPNTAIIGAYARLTENLADCGLARLHYEGPMEHLRRVLTRVRVRPEPLRRLIELFELARFSTHTLTSFDREQAIAALHAVAEDIGASTAYGRTA